MIFMMKDSDDDYNLIFVPDKGLGNIAILTSLNRKDYEYMLNILRDLRRKEADNGLRPFYQFPRNVKRSVTILQVVKRGNDDYCVQANFGNPIFSEMVSVEFDLLIFDLECLQNHQPGTKVYFSPPKE